MTWNIPWSKIAVCLAIFFVVGSLVVCLLARGGSKLDD